MIAVSEAPEVREIFSTIHGSHLYGLAHAKSDVDVFCVTDSEVRKSQHVQNGKYDTVYVGFSTFMERANAGSHQAVEALFSRQKHWALEEYRPIIESSFVCGPEVFAKYERTIRKFAHGDFKQRRHAVRLSFNLQELRATGQFNPEMDSIQVTLASGVASVLEGDRLIERLLG